MEAPLKHVKNNLALNDIKKISNLGLFYIQEKGIPTKVIKQFEKVYRLNKKQIAFLLGVSEKTLYNLLKESVLDQERSDRFLFIIKIFEEGNETFFGPENLINWLMTPQPMLDNNVPFNLLSSITGGEAVHALMIRVKHGILA
ncbi:DUF2384 domain-containing protein [Fulvivirgaceae bacterium BMA10]|uniref:DUF2384 domain-containing protein n=1 Tax=Splendidivirga corallicola TaxID=3051826 RepID=A0ABT8KJZ8_9BACT|nr:DUF2384 domain-containing protein [Fulvivirgaceae bacterium BMA10]